MLCCAGFSKLYNFSKLSFHIFDTWGYGVLLCALNVRIEQDNECKELNVEHGLYIFTIRFSLRVFKSSWKTNVKRKCHCREHKIWPSLDRFTSLSNSFYEIHNNTIHLPLQTLATHFHKNVLIPINYVADLTLTIFQREIKPSVINSACIFLCHFSDVPCICKMGAVT